MQQINVQIFSLHIFLLQTENKNEDTEAHLNTHLQI